MESTSDMCPVSVSAGETQVRQLCEQCAPKTSKQALGQLRRRSLIHPSALWRVLGQARARDWTPCLVTEHVPEPGLRNVPFQLALCSLTVWIS